jgi:phosphoadenosine phosphosulfate reductase
MATSSFQSQSVPLLHLIGRVCPQVPVVFLDTGFHFDETLQFRNHLSYELGINVKNIESIMGHEKQEQRNPDLWASDPGMCCYINKVEPLERALQNYDAWITGLRRDQTKSREKIPILSRDNKGKLKICPLANWSSEVVNTYVERYDLPKHPLHSQGYLSIGCKPCTRAVVAGEEVRSGRWSGSKKTECGLHFDEDGKIKKQETN